jgi:tetratricopeptide (TPR) repeat protein
VEANELNTRAKQLYERGDWQTALELYEQALGLGKMYADNVAQATALDGLGTLYCYRLGQRARAYELYNAAREIWHDTGDAARESATSVNLAGMYQADGRYEEARALLGTGYCAGHPDRQPAPEKSPHYSGRGTQENQAIDD